MPLPESHDREELHTRQILMRSYRRRDGLYEIEARVLDTKAQPFSPPLIESPIPPGTYIHDLSIRLVIDEWLVIHDAIASSDSTPFPVCKEAPPTLAVLKGEKIGGGWNKLIRDKFKGAKGCTHLMEMLSPMATTAMQTLYPYIQHRPVRTDENGRPLKIDSCYAYASNRDVVQRIWPMHYDGPNTLTDKETT